MFYELLSHMYSYVIVRCTLRDLETWLLCNLQAILACSDGRAIEVANEVDADLVELGEGLIDEKTFRERMESRVRACETVLSSFDETDARVASHTGASSETFTDQVIVPGLVEDHRLRVVFA